MLYCYRALPIDLWHGALTAKALIAELPDESSPHVPLRGESSPKNIAQFLRRVTELEKRAHEGFKKLGWEGDIREGPYFFCLPGETQLALGYMLKQDNNGTTFVASPHPLPWVADQSDTVVVQDPPVPAGAPLFSGLPAART